MDPDGRLRDLPLREYRPRPRLRVPEHHVPRAAVAAVDAHNHLGRWLLPDESWAAGRPSSARVPASVEAPGA